MNGNFVVYKSSAGSGKTFTLVKEYLRLALGDEKKLSYNYKRILAVTFTNKAASEMKNRVIEALDQIAHENTLPFIGQLLSEELKITEDSLKERAGYVLSHIIHHYSDFAIGTIDSFTHKIVKTFAYDLKLPVNFTIEMDTQSFYEKVISTLFSKIGEDKYIGRLLKEYALTKAEDNTSWDPEAQIQEFAKLLQKENSDTYIEQLKPFSPEELEGFRKQFLDFIKHYRNTLKTEAQKALDLIHKHQLTDNDFYYKATGPQNFFKKCLDNSVTLEHTQKGRIIDAVNTNKWANEAGQQKEKLLAIIPDLNTYANSLLDFIRENYSYYALCELLSKQMYPLMLLKKIEEISAEQKQEDRLVFISEFNQKIFEIISNEPTPFIYERLGERYQHYLLDEFQDTSSLQWYNILPLLDNSLSNGWFNLIVGDGKQSIYRWRNANVKQFAALPEVENLQNSVTIHERTQSLKRNFSGNVLNTNFRSLETIVHFNNAFFETLSAQLLSENSTSIYKDQSQKTNTKKGGYVSIHYGKINKDELDAFTLQTLKKHVAKAVEDGFELKDICILVRKNTHGNRIADFLMEEKIPIVSSDSLLLQNNFEVNTLIASLNYLANRQDSISAAAVINYLFQSKRLSEQEYHQHISDLAKHKSLFSILQACGIQLPESRLTLNNLFDTCIEIITALNLNRNGYHYLRFFLDEVNEFLVLKNSNITSFFDWWSNRSHRASMIIPDNTNAVKIMTIHAGKGLEFPVVIAPYFNWQVYRANDSWVNVKNEKIQLPVGVIQLTKKVSEFGFQQELISEQQDQVLDNLNLLYVAFTRAVERLHVISITSDSNRQGTVSDWIEKFIGTQLAPGDNKVFELGSCSVKYSSVSRKNFPAFQLEPLHFSSNKNSVRIKASLQKSNDSVEEAKQEGIRIHQILSKIKTHEDIDKAVENAALEGLIDKEDRYLLSKKIRDIIRHPEIVSYFEPGIRCKLEAELITHTGEILRPDRIVFDFNKTILIDYKTGKKNNTHYFKQLLKYESALLAMGYTNIKKLLVYIDEMDVVTGK